MPRKIVPPNGLELGQLVSASRATEPFYSDEVLRVQEFRREGRGKSATWRALCRSNRGAVGWIDAADLQPYYKGMHVIDWIEEHPGITEAGMREAPLGAWVDVLCALTILRAQGEIEWRGPYGNYYARGKAPPCAHASVVDSPSNRISSCRNCGATRAWSSTTWSA